MLICFSVDIHVCRRYFSSFLHFHFHLLRCVGSLFSVSIRLKCICRCVWNTVHRKPFISLLPSFHFFPEFAAVFKCLVETGKIAQISSRCSLVGRYTYVANTLTHSLQREKEHHHRTISSVGSLGECDKRHSKNHIFIFLLVSFQNEMPYLWRVVMPFESMLAFFSRSAHLELEWKNTQRQTIFYNAWATYTNLELNKTRA